MLLALPLQLPLSGALISLLPLPEAWILWPQNQHKSQGKESPSTLPGAPNYPEELTLTLPEDLVLFSLLTLQHISISLSSVPTSPYLLTLPCCRWTCPTLLVEVRACQTY